MSPTVFHSGNLRFYFFSREESRLAQNLGLKRRDLTRAERLIRAHEATLHAAWKDHFER